MGKITFGVLAYYFQIGGCNSKLTVYKELM